MGYSEENDKNGICGPIWVRNDPKTQEGSVSSSDWIHQKLRQKISRRWIEDMARTHSGNKFVMSVWSCVNGRFTGKRHLDCVELVHVLSWLSFCPWLVFKLCKSSLESKLSAVHNTRLVMCLGPAVLRPHVATVHAAHMALFAQAMCNHAQVLSCGRLPTRWCSSEEEVNQYNNRVADKQRS